MKQVFLGALVALAAVVSMPSPAAAPAGERVEKIVVIASGRNVGGITATTTGNRVTVEYVIDDNGRGPRIREQLVLGADGLPTRWEITGKAWFGSPVQETFEIRAGTARWKSTNDAGQATATPGALYLANDASPWINGLLVREALNRPDRTLTVLPGGSVTVEKVRDVTGAGSTFGVYAVNGLDTGPTFVMLDAAQRFAGLLVPGFLFLPESVAAEADAFQQLATTIDAEYLAQVSKRLAHRYDRPVHVTNARVFDARTGRVGEPQTVTVFGRRIVGIRPDAPPAGGVVIDAEGGTLVPGLFDAHSHMGSWLGLLNLAGGVTSVRDTGNDNAMLLDLTRRIESGEVLGPRISRTGFLEGKSAFSASGGFTVADREAALEKVRWYADHGFQGVKLYSSVSPPLVAPVAAEAHRLGLMVHGHVPAFFDVTSAVRDGYDEVTHVNQLLLSFLIDPSREDTRTLLRFHAFGERAGTLDLDAAPFQTLLRLMQERKVAFDPTLVAFDGMLRGRPGVAKPADAPWLDHAPLPMQRSRKAPYLDVKPKDLPRYEASFRKTLEVVKRLHDAGIVIVPGTDDGAGSLVLVSELQLYADAGIPKPDVLRLATLGTARHLGVDGDVGTVETGKLADFLLVPGDPTQDLQLLRQARAVFKDGVVLYPAEMHAALAIRPFSTKPPVRE
jgi:cytosine/adenosine deaminase-related metal-dependent hydrolase